MGGLGRKISEGFGKVLGITSKIKYDFTEVFYFLFSRGHCIFPLGVAGHTNPFQKRGSLQERPGGPCAARANVVGWASALGGHGPIQRDM